MSVRSVNGVQKKKEFFNVSNSRVVDCYIANFVVAHGLPFEVVSSDSFRQLCSALSPQLSLPTPRFVEVCANRLGSQANLLTNVPLSVTLSMESVENRYFIAISAHHFSVEHQRRDVVYFREMMMSSLDGAALLTAIRRAISGDDSTCLKFENLVVPSPELRQMMLSDVQRDESAVKRTFVCLHHYMSTFVQRVLLIPELADGLQRLREFVQSVVGNPEEYARFKNLQSTKKEDLDLPALDTPNWQSTEAFLTRCLILYESITEYALRNRAAPPITDDVFLQLVELHSFLQHCVRYSRNLSSASSSISQVLPTVFGLQRWIRCIHAPRVRLGRTREILRQENDTAMIRWIEVDEAFNSVLAPLLQSSAQLERWELATLLDPRFAYLPHLFGAKRWTAIERKLDERVGWPSDVIRRELQYYRPVVHSNRPEEFANPFIWWARSASKLPFLSAAARELLACPAVAVDAGFHFGVGGKFGHVCKNYGPKLLESVLNAAGAQQKFRGRGAPIGSLHSAHYEKLKRVVAKVEQEVSRSTEIQEGEIKEEPLDEQPTTSSAPVENAPTDYTGTITNDPNQRLLKKYQPKAPTIFKRKTVSRHRCTICHALKNLDELKSVAPANERLMLMLSATSQCIFSEEHASHVLTHKRLMFVCHEHFVEACREILLVLGIKKIEQIDESPCIPHVMRMFARLGHSPSSEDDLKWKLTRFVDKYYEHRYHNSEQRVYRQSEEPNPETAEQKPQLADFDAVILPKPCRQPRKQVLETEHDDPTVKLIEQEPFQLPELKPAVSLGLAEPPITAEQCCYCSIQRSRQDMVRVPKSEPRAQRWQNALGEEFRNRLKSGENFVCRAHFDRNSFSRRGRLLEGKVPNVAPEKVEVTYRIQGEHFLRLAEQRNGGKDVTFDLEHVVKLEPESSGNEEEEEEEEVKPIELMVAAKQEIEDPDELDEIPMKKSKF